MKTLLILAVSAFLTGFLWASDPPSEAPAATPSDTQAVASDVSDADAPAETENAATDLPDASDADLPAETDEAVETVQHDIRPDTTTAVREYQAEEAEPAELSTELDGLDTLNVVPTEMMAQIGGGTRRVGLESTVFRRENPVIYDAAGRRDPFRALITDEKKEGEVETEFLRLEGASLKGVVWSDGQYLALIADKDGKSFVLREGDLVFQGRVISVTQSKAIFEISDFGDYQQVTLKVRG